MENLKDIVKGTTAKLTHICAGKAYYRIDTREHAYQLELNCNNEEWKETYMFPEFKAITLMRWIRKGIEKQDNTFIMLK